jgi:hypothetical protein
MKISFKGKVNILFLAFVICCGFSDNNDNEAVKQSVELMFQGMFHGDSAMVHSVFWDDVRMYTSFTTDEGKEGFREGSLDNFLRAVGTPHDIAWDERIWNLQISVDDNLAHAWMEYAFYLGDQFSHCGVNAMQFVKMDGHWKIVHLIDTRRKEDCDIPEDVRK